MVDDCAEIEIWKSQSHNDPVISLHLYIPPSSGNIYFATKPWKVKPSHLAIYKRSSDSDFLVFFCHASVVSVTKPMMKE